MVIIREESKFEFETKVVNNRDSFILNVVRFILNYLTRFSIAGIVVYVCWIAIRNYHYWFSWHVILCTFGYLPLMAESIMLFLSDEVWATQISRTAKYTVHGILISVGTVMIISGDSIVFHYITPGYHLYTAHGITGFVSMICIILSIPVGIAVKYHRNIKHYLPLSSVGCKFVHNILGILGYGIGIMSLCFAFYTNWFVYYTEYESRILALTVTILAAAWTMNGAVVSLYHQMKSLIF